MALNIKSFLLGLRIFPKSGSTISAQGELEVDSATTKLNYHNGTTAAPVLTTTSTDTLTNKALSDSTTTIVDNSDATKKIAFDAAGTTGTTTTITGSQTANRTLTLPDATDTLVGKATTDTLTNKTFDADGSGNSITNIENADIKAAAAIALNKLAAATASRALVSDASGFVSAATTTSTEIGYVNGLTSALQTQLDARTFKNTLTTTGDMYYASSANTPARLALGSANQVIKSVNGIPTWATVAAGGINYINSNPDAEVDTTGWATYADAAGAQPVNGTGGSPNSTWTRTTSSPLRGAGSFLFTKSSGASRQGEGASFDFTIDDADKYNVLAVNFDYEVASGTYVDGDLTVYLYDVTNSVVIQPAGYSISNVGVESRHQATFQCTGSTSYRLIFHVAVATDSANTIKIDNVSVGPQVKSYGPFISDWASYTTTCGLTGGTTSFTGKWRRVGDTLETQITAVFATVFTGGTATFSLPSGLSIDTDKFGATPSAGSEGLNMGTAEFHDVGTDVFKGYVQYNDTTTVKVVAINDDQGTGGAYLGTAGVSTTVPMTWANNDRMILRFSVPITGWSSSQLLSSDADTRIVAAKYKYTSGAPEHTSNGAFQDLPSTLLSSSQGDTHAAYNTTTNVFTVPVPGWYEITGLIGLTANATGVRAAKLVKTAVDVGNTAEVVGSASIVGFLSPNFIVNCVAGDTLKIQVYQNSGGNLTYAAVGAQNYLQFKRLSGPSQISASESVNARYYASSTTISSTLATIVWTTKDFDSHNAMSSGVFTCPVAGKYQVNVGLSINGTYAINAEDRMEIQKNGTAISAQQQFAQAAVGAQGHTFGDVISCLAGDTLRIQVLTNSTTPTIRASNIWNYISITRIGN